MYEKDGSTLSLSQHSAVVKRCCYAPRCGFAAACPPEPRFPRRGAGGGEPRAAARTYANEKARTHRAGLFHSSGWLAPTLRRHDFSISFFAFTVKVLELWRVCGFAAACHPEPRLPPEGDGRGRALRRSAWLSPFAAASSAALLPGRAASPVRIAAARRAAGSPTPQAWAFPLALPFPECGAQRRACCLPLSTVLCYTWGGGVRYGKVPPHDIRRPPAP